MRTVLKIKRDIQISFFYVILGDQDNPYSMVKFQNKPKSNRCAVVFSIFPTPAPFSTLFYIALVQEADPWTMYFWDFFESSLWLDLDDSTILGCGHQSVSASFAKKSFLPWIVFLPFLSLFYYYYFILFLLFRATPAACSRWRFPG